MTGIVRGNAIDQVNTVHGATGENCAAAPIITATDECSSMVFAGAYGVVRQDDKVQSHIFPGCSSHAPGLTTYHPNIVVEGKGLAQEGDTYGCGARIITSSADIILG